MTDLETRIRAALRTDEIGYYDLRQPQLRTPAPDGHRRTWLPAVAAAAVVAALAAVLAGIDFSPDPGPPVTGATSFVGYDWRLTEVTDQKGTVEVPASGQASIAFGVDGEVFGSATGGSLWGSYRVTGAGYEVTDAGLSAQRPSAPGPRANRVLGGLASVFFHVVGRTMQPAQPATVRARVHGDVLVLRVPGLRLTLARAGQATVSPILGATGYAWRLTALRDAKGRLPVPAGMHPLIAFTRDGFILAKDTVNTEHAGLVPTPEGYTVTHLGGTFAVYSGADPDRVRVINAIGEALPGSGAGVVTASLAGDTLVLTHGGTTLTLQRGPAVPFAGIASSASASASASAAPMPVGPLPAPQSGAARVSSSPVPPPTGAVSPAGS